MDFLKWAGSSIRMTPSACCPVVFSVLAVDGVGACNGGFTSSPVEEVSFWDAETVLFLSPFTGVFGCWGLAGDGEGLMMSRFLFEGAPPPPTPPPADFAFFAANLAARCAS